MPQEELLNIDEAKDIKPQLDKIPEKFLRQLVKQAGHWADYQKYTDMMNGIAFQMKEIPVLPSEQHNPEDTNALEKVEFPPEGGVLTFMNGYDLPFKGYPHHEFVDKIDFIKKVNRGMLSGLYHQFKDKNKLWFVTLLPGLWLTRDVLRAWVYVFYRHIDRFKIKTDRYSTAMREIYRALSQPIAGEKLKEMSFREQIRDLLCMVLEFDNAYRFRAQDILGELNLWNLEQNPRKEILRLIDIMVSREKTQEIKDTWKLLRMVIRFYLMFDPGLQKIIVHLLSGIDLQKVKLDNGDKIFCIPRRDYTFGFVLNPTEEDTKIISVHTLLEQAKAEMRAVKELSTKEHANVKDPQKLEALDDKYNTLLQGIHDRFEAEKQQLLPTNS